MISKQLRQAIEKYNIINTRASDDEIQKQEDLIKYTKYGELAGLVFQQEMEKMAWEAGGKTQAAPAQRMVDFTNGKFSNTLNECSYIPGINSAPLHELLPSMISNRLQEGFKIFGRKMKGYFTNEANILGVETRTTTTRKGTHRAPNCLTINLLGS